MDTDSIRYIEHKTGHNDDGPAWIARVQFSKSGKTIYFNGMGLKSAKGRGVGANYYDFASGDEYWVSGVKTQEWNRHWVGSGDIMIERSLYDWYLGYINFQETGFLKVIDDLPVTDITAMNQLENR